MARISTEARISAEPRFSADTFQTQDSIEKLRSSEGSSVPLAVISCLPPAETGIATASLLSFSRAEFPIHIFGHFSSSFDYLSTGHHPALSGSKLSIFHVAALPYAQRKVRYGAQLYVIGNSGHNMPTIECMRKQTNGAPPIYVYVHDPVLLHAAELLSLSRGESSDNAISRLYGRRFKRVSHDELVAEKIYGARVLLEDVPVRGIFANSRAAVEMLAREFPHLPVYQAFHPIFEVKTGHRNEYPENLRIGAFGIPGGDKRILDVIRALEIIREQVPDAQLVMAGYHAGSLLSAHTLPEGIEVHESPPDEAFDRLIGSVDIAVQLRQRHNGESSGVVARVLAADVPLIVSRIGAFQELGEAVAYLEPQSGPEELARIILAEVHSSEARRSSRLEYVRSHSASRLCNFFLDTIRADQRDSAVGCAYPPHIGRSRRA